MTYELPSLTALHGLLAAAGAESADLWVPKTWLGGTGQAMVAAEDGALVCVPRGEFYQWCIQNITESAPTHRPPARQAHAQVIYGTFLRSVTCIKRPGGGYDAGTMIRFLAILPQLQDLGVNCIYLLPVSKMGQKYRKGTLGSPYSGQALTSFEPSLHEEILGDPTAEILALQFSALVEAAHHCGMNVILDLSLRTVSRDSELIAEYPEAFYWRDLAQGSGAAAAPPHVPEVGKNIPFRTGLADALYRAPALDDYRRSFKCPPSTTNPEKWLALKRDATSPAHLLEMIEQHFGITTASAFSDCINDEQPLWSDVTYLRFFSDEWGTTEGRPQQEAPYCLQDSASLNVGTRQAPFNDLQKMMTRVPAWWLETFNLDGLRIDSAHAFSHELNDSIVRQCRESRPDAVLWGEGFSTEDASHLQGSGYDLFTGTSWTAQHHEENGVADSTHPDGPANIRPLAAAELHDSPRLWSRVEGDLSKFKQSLEHLAREDSPLFLMAGMELAESRPMNLGLEPQSDLLAGENVRLPLFDAQELPWQNQNSETHAAVRAACRLKTERKGTL
jgi:starch synthase (maltosyl-transferring)